VCVLQTKGVRSIVKIEATDAAWYSAVAGVGAGLLGTLAVWPFMRKLLRQYDEQNSLPKDAQAESYKTSGIEEDRSVTRALDGFRLAVIVRCSASQHPEQQLVPFVHT
jgi:hypothetical protein